MPEGDTIHRAAAGLARVLVGKTILRAESPLVSIVRAGLVGRRIDAVEALGKNLLVRFDDGRTLHTRMRMTGSWHLYRPGERPRKPAWRARVVLEVEGAVAMCFDAPVVRLVRSEERDPALSRVGPDVLGEELDIATARSRVRALAGHSIAEAITDQRAVSGIGNIYKSEVLFARKIDPRALVESISDDALDALLVEARELMSRNLARNARTQGARRPSRVYMRAGEACVACGTTIERLLQGGRSTYYCPRCQRP